MVYEPTDPRFEKYDGDFQAKLNAVEKYELLSKLLIDPSYSNYPWSESYLLSRLRALLVAYRQEHNWNIDEDPTATDNWLSDIGDGLSSIEDLLR